MTDLFQLKWNVLVSCLHEDSWSMLMKIILLLLPIQTWRSHDSTRMIVISSSLCFQLKVYFKDHIYFQFFQYDFVFIPIP